VKLEGSLDAFGLPDIFQLLSYTKKTGGLHLRNDSVQGVVFFASGAVTGASGDLGRQTLARRLVGGGTIGDDALRSAVDRAQGEGCGVGRALLDAGAAPADVVQQAATDQAVDAVFDLLGWAEGDFSFAVDEGNPDDVGIELSTEKVVAEAAARREAADRVAAQIASQDVVLAMPVVPPADLEMSPDEWALVALADGRRSVGEIAELTGSGYVTVVQALAGLATRGLLTRGGEDDHATAVRRRLALLAPLESERTAPAPAEPAPTEPAPTEPAPTEPAPTRPAATQETPGNGAAVSASTSPAGSLAPRSGSFVPATPAPVGSAAPAAAPARPALQPPATDASAAPVGAPVGAASGSAPDAIVEADLVTTIGGPHVPDGVVPPRPEPFQPKRVPDHPEVHPAHPGRTAFDGPRPDPAARPASVPTSMGAGVGGVNGSAAMAADPEAAAVIERDPSVNRSLLLRLIAGVRGL
jgi:Domain of unknown function (DUF4388)